MNIFFSFFSFPRFFLPWYFFLEFLFELEFSGRISVSFFSSLSFGMRENQPFRIIYWSDFLQCDFLMPDLFVEYRIAAVFASDHLFMDRTLRTFPQFMSEWLGVTFQQAFSLSTFFFFFFFKKKKGGKILERVNYFVHPFEIWPEHLLIFSLNREWLINELLLGKTPVSPPCQTNTSPIWWCWKKSSSLRVNLS